MDKVNQLTIKEDMKVSELIEQFDKSGVLGSGRVARASRILEDMITDDEMNVFMSLGGPLIPGGLRNIVTNMIREKHVNLIISSGANITHDLLKAFGGNHYRDEGRDDEDLPVYHGGSSMAEEHEEIVYGETESFYDQLKEQMMEMDLTDRQRDIIPLAYRILCQNVNHRCRIDQHSS